MDIVNKILEEEEIAQASTIVTKHLELKFDLGTLLATDENQLDVKGEKLQSRAYSVKIEFLLPKTLDGTVGKFYLTMSTRSSYSPYEKLCSSIPYGENRLRHIGCIRDVLYPIFSTRENIDIFLKSLARDNTQLLINKIWTLPKEKREDVTVAILPKPTTVLPRARPVPKPREPTKWEKFAKEKGIQKKKKDKVKWDDVLQKWVPLHGYKRAEAEKEKDWVLEVPVTSDPYEDQFEKKKNEKSERVAKNEFQRLRNIAKAKNIKVPKVGLAPTARPSSAQIGAALTIAKASTASLGKFQAKLPKEKEAKGVKDLLPGRKRKAPPLAINEEKKRALSLVDNILNKKPKINIDHAVEKEVHSINQEENKKKPKAKKGRKTGGKTKTGAKGGKFRGPSTGKGAAAGGARKGAPATGGRKGGGAGGGRKGSGGGGARVGGKNKAGRKRR